LATSRSGRKEGGTLPCRATLWNRLTVTKGRSSRFRTPKRRGEKRRDSSRTARAIGYTGTKKEDQRKVENRNRPGAAGRPSTPSREASREPRRTAPAPHNRPARR
jgi:hypothetical protein